MFMHVIYSWDSVYSRFGHSFVVKKKKIEFYHWQLFSLNLTPTNTFWYVKKKKGKKKKEKFNIYFKIRIFKAVTD